MDHHHLAREKQISSGNVEREKRARGARSRRTRGIPALYIVSLHTRVRVLRARDVTQLPISHEEREREKENKNLDAGRKQQEKRRFHRRSRECRSQSAVFHDPPRHRVSSRCSPVRAHSRDVTHVVLSHNAHTHARTRASECARTLRTTHFLDLDHPKLAPREEIRQPGTG